MQDRLLAASDLVDGGGEHEARRIRSLAHPDKSNARHDELQTQQHTDRQSRKSAEVSVPSGTRRGRSLEAFNASPA